MKPTPVAVNKAIADCDKCPTRTTKVSTLTVNNLGRYLDPESLFLGIMKVDEFRKEEHDRCSPEY